MKQIDNIINNPKYREYLLEIAECEKDRIFCKHDVEHFLSVARIMYIRSLENNLGIEKPIIYATALLHDIGRHIQYKNGTPHALASIDLAEEILNAVGGFSSEEISRILFAISKHNSSKTNDELADLLQWADHESRSCFNCAAKPECKWSEEEKNREVII